MFQTDKDSAVETDGQVHHRIYLTIFANSGKICVYMKKVCQKEESLYPMRN